MSYVAQNSQLITKLLAVTAAVKNVNSRRASRRRDMKLRKAMYDRALFSGLGDIHLDTTRRGKESGFRVFRNSFVR